MKALHPRLMRSYIRCRRMSNNYADSIAQAQRNAAGKGEKKKRDAGLSADIAAELKGALDDVEPPIVPEPTIVSESPAVVAPSKRTGVQAAAAHLPAARTKRVPAEEQPVPTVDTTSPQVSAARPQMIRQGIEFRREDLDLITEMLYRCHRQKINLQGKKGPSVMVRVALDELTAIYATEPERFDAIMSRYAEKKKSASA